MRYSIEPKDRIYVKESGFLYLAKNMSNKNSQKLLDTAKKSTADAIKTSSKRAIQKVAEATSDLIRNRIADKITNISKHLRDNYIHKIMKLMIKQKYQQIIDELRLV